MKVHTYVREHSVRVPRKNFRQLGGEPLWRRTLRKYRGHEVYLDTDSDALIREIQADPEMAHVLAYPRAPEHRTGEPGLAMTRRFLAEFCKPDEVVALVHVTSPFLDPRRVEHAWEQVVRGPYDSAASVTLIRDYCYRTEARRLIPLNHDGRAIPGTQTLTPVVRLNHAFFVFSRRSLDRWNHRIGEDCLTVPLPHPEDLDIDYEEDFRIAEALVAGGFG